jgi:hypothetical protein
MDSLNASLARVAVTCQDIALLLFCICKVIALHVYALTSQIVSLKTDWVNIENSCPGFFAEQGVAMLSGILNSEKAINMNIAIMSAFVEVRKVFLKQNDLRD